jgi:hypothetical protein
MPATPAAPAFKHDAAFSIVTPPRASTGIFATQACRNAVRPVGCASGTLFFSKTGAKTAKSASADAARITFTRVAGDSYEKLVATLWPEARTLQDTARFTRSDIFRTQMNAIGSGSERDICAMVD